MAKKSFFVSALKQQFYECKVIAETKEEADELARELWFNDELGSDCVVVDWKPAPNEILDIGLERGDEGVWEDSGHKCTPDNHVGTCDDCMTKEE
tara:strand:+ start:110 stop:394 length:285 start_codon:yes stop_codon:yes gene_type:complete